MKITVLIAAIILGLALPVAAQFKTIQEAYEVQLSDLRLPQNDVGTVAFKTCRECPYQVKRVTGATEWVLDGNSMPLAKFRLGVMRLSERDNTAVTVLHHLENDRVTRVSVHIFRQQH